MNFQPTTRLAITIGFTIGFGLPSSAVDSVDFNRDVLPILANSCFQCHGPDPGERQAGLRLDQEAGALAYLESGNRAVVPEDLGQSALIQRIVTKDTEIRMPPADSGKTLGKTEVNVLKSWIRQGAAWSQHWAYMTPEMPPTPQLRVGENSPIDGFIRQQLDDANLTPAFPADKATLIRRVTLDLTGLPPTLGEIEKFLSDDSSNAYSKIVDRLLASPRYGEHMTRHWLDASRYADTHGLHLDNERSMWPYRNWVIHAFNQNMPFDQFTIEQLAGDLLPQPTLSQIVATGFNRCNVTTNEGGSIDAEYYVRYAVDRVETTSTVWLGLTAGCAACHDHKFDPLSQKEFYQLFSYFFSLTEKAMDGNALLPPPVTKVPDARQKQRQQWLQDEKQLVAQQINAKEKQFKYHDPVHELAELPSFQQTSFIWIDDNLPSKTKAAGDGNEPWQFVTAPQHPVLTGSQSFVRAATGLSQHYFTGADPALDIGDHDVLFAYVLLAPANPPKTVQLQFHSDSWEHRVYWGENRGHGKDKKGAANHHAGDLPEPGQWTRLEVPARVVGLAPGSKVDGWAFTQYDGTVYWDKSGVDRFNPLSSEQKRSLRIWEKFSQTVKTPLSDNNVQSILAVAAEQRTDEQKQAINRYFVREIHPEGRTQFQPLLKRQSELDKQLSELDKSIPATLIMEERVEPRQAYVLERGEYELKGDKVYSRLPSWLPAGSASQRSDRLGLARWLVDPIHPLTARVTVNRFWQQYFGTGLVETTEDFGVQGTRPSHPELLDWLALEFVRSGWNVKNFQKLLVTSATYRQSAYVTPQKLARDPNNRLLSRGPRFRLDAEAVRDNALAISGLLVGTIGGKSVKPYQPEGLWKPVGFGGSNTAIFKQDTGSALYRRSMYTFWKRTSPPPTMEVFDAPTREMCRVRRSRTNTPLQALILMNDVQFVEAARRFAERIMVEGGKEFSERLEFAFRSVTARQPTEDEHVALETLYREYLTDFRSETVAAKQLLSLGASKRNDGLVQNELAAWTMIGHLLLNLDESITKG